MDDSTNSITTPARTAVFVAGDLSDTEVSSRLQIAKEREAVVLIGLRGEHWMRRIALNEPTRASLTDQLERSGQTLFLMSSNQLAKPIADSLQEQARRLHPRIQYLAGGDIGYFWIQNGIVTSTTLYEIPYPHPKQREAAASDPSWVKGISASISAMAASSYSLSTELPLDLVAHDGIDIQRPDENEIIRAGYSADRILDHHVLLELKLPLTIGVHDTFIDETVGYFANGMLTSRAIALPASPEISDPVMVIINTTTSRVNLLDRDGKRHRGSQQVTELHPGMTGRYLLVAVDSHHVMDLNSNHVRRISGGDAMSAGIEPDYRLLTLGICRIGERATWRTPVGEYTSTMIRHIIKLKRGEPRP